MRSAAALAVLCVLAFNTAFLYCVTRYLVSRSALSAAELALLRIESGSARKADQILESVKAEMIEAESEGASETGGPSNALVEHEELEIEMNIDIEIGSSGEL